MTEESDPFEDMTEEEAWDYLSRMFDRVPAANRYQSAIEKGFIKNIESSVSYELGPSSKDLE